MCQIDSPLFGDILKLYYKRIIDDINYKCVETVKLQTDTQMKYELGSMIISYAVIVLYRN